MPMYERPPFWRVPHQRADPGSEPRDFGQRRPVSIPIIFSGHLTTEPCIGAPFCLEIDRTDVRRHFVHRFICGAKSHSVVLITNKILMKRIRMISYLH